MSSSSSLIIRIWWSALSWRHRTALVATCVLGVVALADVCHCAWTERRLKKNERDRQRTDQDYKSGKLRRSYRDVVASEISKSDASLFEIYVVNIILEYALLDAHEWQDTLDQARSHDQLVSTRVKSKSQWRLQWYKFIFKQMWQQEADDD